jgi:hypothetical protein
MFNPMIIPWQPRYGAFFLQIKHTQPENSQACWMRLRSFQSSTSFLRRVYLIF